MRFMGLKASSAIVIAAALLLSGCSEDENSSSAYSSTVSDSSSSASSSSVSEESSSVSAITPDPHYLDNYSDVVDDALNAVDTSKPIINEEQTNEEQTNSDATSENDKNGQNGQNDQTDQTSSAPSSSSNVTTSEPTSSSSSEPTTSVPPSSSITPVGNPKPSYTPANQDVFTRDGDWAWLGDLKGWYYDPTHSYRSEEEMQALKEGYDEAFTGNKKPGEGEELSDEAIAELDKIFGLS